MNTVETGRSGEQVAADFLEEHGYEILDRNFTYKKVGEIDIVARYDGMLVFVEVRSRYSLLYGSPEASLTLAKLRGVRRTAEAWMVQRRCYGMPCRFDVMAIDHSSGSLKVRHLENAF
jgi:putative endonuclease